MKLTIRNLKNRRIVKQVEIPNRGASVIPREATVEVVNGRTFVSTFLPFDKDRHYISINR